MGAETTATIVEAAAPEIVGLQPSALVDHMARVDWSVLNIPGETGGSLPVAIEELEYILSQVKIHLPSSKGQSPLKTIVGGSVANTIRGLASGFGVTCGIIGACGDDEQGKLFMYNMNSNNVNLSNLKMKKGATAQCVCLVDASGYRTMRPCLSSAVRLQWLVLRYGILNLELIHAAVRIAKQEQVFVSLDLASFEWASKNRKSIYTEEDLDFVRCEALDYIQGFV